MTKGKILAVDDEYLIRWTLEQNLLKKGYEVVLAETGEEALVKIKEEGPDLVLLDIKLPGMDGYEVLEKILKIDCDIIPIMMTAYDDVEKVVKAMRLGALDYITKPLDFKKVLLSIEKALAASQVDGEMKRVGQERRYPNGYDQITAVSDEMKKVLQMAEKIARSDASTILLQGESGTGKELIARTIHGQSKRCGMPFITVNCAGFLETLLENELCGHEKWAFTDAKDEKKGLLEMADGGTLFLDEIGDMSLNLQAKILRLVEHRTFRRMAGLKDIQVDVRIITATNKDLIRLKDTGAFREDLFYRINVASIRIPPLRERPSDILPLLNYFVERYNGEFHKNVQTISEEVKGFFAGYGWPGNVREIKNVVEGAMILIDGGTLLLEHLPAETLEQASRYWATAEGIQIPPEGISLEKVEEALVRQALKMTHGNQTKAAKLLDISRDALRYRLQKLGAI